ncbi:MAG: hypothetical protein R2779_05780 [Crocinitomicaceae bacterium]
MKITTIILTFTFLTCFSAGWAQLRFELGEAIGRYEYCKKN